MMANSLIILSLLLASNLALPGITVTPGVSVEPPPGYYAYNYAPTFHSTDNGQIYIPNFRPGFRVGLTNTSLQWDSGPGYAHIGYSVGPWKYLEVALPHMAVGPQCCNFNEVPQTKQFTSADWSNHNYSRAGFMSPGVNVPNATIDLSAPAYIGLRTDWQWTVSFSLDWSTPKLLNPDNQWAALGIAATLYVPNAPNKLVYTVVNFWMDSNSSRVLGGPQGSSANPMIPSSDIVVYHPTQLEGITGNQTITVELSPYLEDTLRVLGFATTTTEPPVISYVYLNIEGYNMQWSTTLFSFFIMTNHAPSAGDGFQQPLYYLVPVVFLALAATLYATKKRKKT